jgi:hypothetical protein
LGGWKPSFGGPRSEAPLSCVRWADWGMGGFVGIPPSQVTWVVTVRTAVARPAAAVEGTRLLVTGLHARTHPQRGGGAGRSPLRHRPLRDHMAGVCVAPFPRAYNFVCDPQWETAGEPHACNGQVESTNEPPNLQSALPT